jgi:hypothetical protein
MLSFKKYFESTNLEPNELKVGDSVHNCNKECKHYGSKGVVKQIHKSIDEDGNVVGNEIEYQCVNCGPTWKEGDCLKKTEIQLQKV